MLTDPYNNNNNKREREVQEKFSFGREGGCSKRGGGPQSMITREAFSTCWRRTFLVGCLRRFPFSVFLSGEDKDECDGDDGEEEEDGAERKVADESRGARSPRRKPPCSSTSFAASLRWFSDDNVSRRHTLRISIGRSDLCRLPPEGSSGEKEETE
ncbi:hypothetical protein CEXT_707231 [Caerostris extrusa]|uniref:Uncharacterized protein n=1 Tax=Caerostris extrusa TaxID=172846 RepID=A0AAV4R324_CAEEX|nr:hypothetical protein CEXT_707231 [Caerostris extrusa]